MTLNTEHDDVAPLRQIRQFLIPNFQGNHSGYLKFGDFLGGLLKRGERRFEVSHRFPCEEGFRSLFLPCATDVFSLLARQTVFGRFILASPPR